MDPLVDERFRGILPYLKGERPWRLASPEEISLGYEAAASDEESEKEAL